MGNLKEKLVEGFLILLYNYIVYQVLTCVSRGRLMSRINTKHFKIVLNANVGIINDKKAETLTKVFENEFQLKMLQEQQPVSSVFVLANPNLREAILIDSNKITYQIESEESITPDFGAIKEKLQKIYDTLLLDDVSVGVVHYVGQAFAKSYNAMNESIENFSGGSNLREQMPNLKGIGLRFLLEHHTGIWEYKVEPFISDISSYFIEMICNIGNPQKVEEIVHIAEEAYIDFNDKKLNALETLGV